MGRSAVPTTVVFWCPLADDLSESQLTGCLDAGAGSPSTTWSTSLERLPLVLGHRSHPGSQPHVSLEIPAAALPSRQMLRQLLAAARRESSDIDTAVVRGPLPQDARRTLVDGGFGVVLRDRLESQSRGARRPAPSGWPCRSVLWGLWEVVAGDGVPPGMLGGLLPWTTDERLRPGGMAVVDLAGPRPTPASIRSRIDRWQAWSRWRGSGSIDVATLSAVPELISGASRRTLSGSVLKAA